ncbi:PCNA-associated factor-like [Ornithodoros turicata]|uniref:PCNA-associated factor-like n=1 Tax=Ornithodoros turicata TaxID=34597 RepID=UPI00313A02D2
MVRTKADGACKAIGAKSSRKGIAIARASGGASSSSAGAKGSGSDKYSGGNPYCPRPTPPWQKEISGFLIKTKPTSESNQSMEDTSSLQQQDDGDTSSEK